MTDYSKEAVAQRLRQVSESRRLGISLKTAGEQIRETAMPTTLPRFAERGWPISRAGPPRIVLAEGRIGTISIFDTRADVERILGIQRKSLWGVRDEPAPAIALRITFESDEDQLYDSEEMLLVAKEWDDVWRIDAGPREESVEEGVARRLALEQQRSAEGEGPEPTTDEIALLPTRTRSSTSRSIGRTLRRRAGCRIPARPPRWWSSPMAPARDARSCGSNG